MQQDILLFVNASKSAIYYYSSAPFSSVSCNKAPRALALRENIKYQYQPTN
jgi:hypothetical protein